MKAIFFIICTALLLTSCSKVYYVGETTTPVTLYSTQDIASETVTTIPLTKKVLVKKRSRKFSHVIYENYQGYAYKPVLKNYHRFNSSNDGNLYGYSTLKNKSRSQRNLSRHQTSQGGPVHVKGYHRKNGTYVRPHTRSAPTRRR